MKTGHLLFASLLLLSMVIIPSRANETRWVQTNGPEGGLINTIEIDRVHPNILYAGGAGGGVFMSTDGGTTWKMLQQIVSPSEQIQEILLSSDDPQIIYALAGWLFKSTNGDESWRVIAPNLRFTCVTMDYTDSQAILAGTWKGKVYHTANGGRSWTNITSNLPGDRIADIAIGANNEFWVGTANGRYGRLYHTINGGISWNEIDIRQSVDTDIHTIFVDPENRSIVYVGLIDVHNEMFDSQNDNYLLKTTNGGKIWTSIRLPGTDAMINIMGRDLTDDTIYVGTGGRVYKSNDGGQRWTLIGPPGQNGDMRDIAVDPRNNDILYLPRRSYGIIKSINGGATWTSINQGLSNVRVSLLAVPNVHGSGTVYATSHGEATFKTTDWGSSWTCLNEGGLNGICSDELVVSPHDPAQVWYVVGTADVLQTTDGGTTWGKIIDPRPDGNGFRFGSVYALAPAPSDPLIIYSLANGFGIFKTTDGGESWRFLRESEVDYTYSIAVHPTDPDIVYSGYLPKPFQDWAMIRRTLDGGDSWGTILHLPQSSAVSS